MGQLAVVEERKDRLIEKLSTQYSLNQISIEEYERLLKFSQDIETDKELTIFEKIIEEHSLPEINSDNPRDDNKKMSKKAPQEHFTLLSSKKTTGPLTRGNFTAILGEHKAVINADDLINEKTVINVTAILGDIVIHVPEDVCVINRVFPILADVSIADDLKYKGGRKKLVIRGNAILGEIKVKIRKP